jgi:hypothetical protein
MMYARIMNERVLEDKYGGDMLLYYIDHDPQEAWHMIARWYFDNLCDSLQKRGIDIVLTMPYEHAIACLGKQFYTGYSRLYALNRYSKQQTFHDYDTETSKEERTKWREEVWDGILTCMIEVSNLIGDYLKHYYDSSFANDYFSLLGVVDARTIYGLVYKTTEDLDDSSDHSQSDFTDGDYDTDDN